MKSRLCILTLVGLAACSMAAFAQTTPGAGDNAAPAAAGATETNNVAAASEAPAQPAAETAAATAPAAQPAAEAPAPAPAAEPAAETPAPAPAAETAASAPASEAPASTDAKPVEVAQATAAPAADAATSTASAAPASAPGTQGAVIPLIVMDDVPLTDAIKNLARQAGLNYMLDPKVAFGQAGPDGRPVPQPMVSIRWENITAEQALTALLGNYNLQLVEDPKSKIARVTVKDPAAPDPLTTKVIQLKYAAPTNILMAVQNTLTDKRSKVIPDVRTSQLVVLATDKEMADVDTLVERLDTPTKQVLIEARLLETAVNPSTVKGVDWSGTLERQIVTFGNVAHFSPATTMRPTGGPFFNPSTFFLDADGVALALSFLNKYTETKVISAPRTVTLDNEPAHIEVGTQYPIVNVTAGTANTTGGSQVTYSNLTVRLDVIPRISANNYVNLKVTPHAMRLQDVKTIKAGSGGSGGGGLFDVPVFDTRTIDTTVMIPSGNTLVMGGLMEDNITDKSTKVPVLGDIPGLGYLFRVDNKSRTKSTLTVFLTPTIVEDEDYQPTKTTYLKTPVPTEDNLGPDWSAWDSGKPGDPFEKVENVNDPEKYSTIRGTTE